jgi:hypothetical protein
MARISRIIPDAALSSSGCERHLEQPATRPNR